MYRSHSAVHDCMHGMLLLVLAEHRYFFMCPSYEHRSDPSPLTYRVRLKKKSEIYGRPLSLAQAYLLHTTHPWRMAQPIEFTTSLAHSTGDLQLKYHTSNFVFRSLQRSKVTSSLCAPRAHCMLPELELASLHCCWADEVLDIVQYLFLVELGFTCVLTGAPVVRKCGSAETEFCGVITSPVCIARRLPASLSYHGVTPWPASFRTTVPVQSSLRGKEDYAPVVESTRALSWTERNLVLSNFMPDLANRSAWGLVMARRCSSDASLQMLLFSLLAVAVLRKYM